MVFVRREGQRIPNERLKCYESLIRDLSIGDAEDVLPRTMAGVGLRPALRNRIVKVD
jgi:hypothetical protein